MSRSALIACVVLVAGGALLALRFVSAERGSTEVERGVQERAKGEVAAAPLVTPELVPQPATVQREASASDEAPQTRAARSTSRAESGLLPGDSSARISGRVVVAGGPPQEEMHVLAQFRRRMPWLGAADASASVAADGSFEVPVPSSAQDVLLDVNAPSFGLGQPVSAQPGDDDIVLEAEALGEIAVTIVPPPGVARDPRAPWTIAAVELTVTREVERRIDCPSPGTDGRLEILRVPFDCELALEVTHARAAPWKQRLAPLAPGERREVMVELERGISIAGRVVDENGAPVGGVEVELRPLRTGEPSALTGKESTSADDAGAFEFAGIASRDWTLTARSPDVARVEEQTIAGSRGDVRGLELRVARGQPFRGTVEWADGSPLLDGTLSLNSPGEWTHPTLPIEKGEFSFLAEPGTYDLVAQGTRDGTRGLARVRNVRPGGEPIRLVLDETIVRVLHAEVVDPEGKRIESFYLSWSDASRELEGSGYWEGGGFTLTVPDGEYGLDVGAKGFLKLHRDLTIGVGGPESLCLVLQPAGVVRGRVVDARGEPVRGARVGEEFRELATSGADGVFEFRPGEPRVTFHASRSGLAPSESVDLDVASGVVVEDVILRLRDPAGLRGRVLDPDGRPLAGVLVDVTSMPVAAQGLGVVESDAEGRFVFDDLPPGKVDVSASSPGEAPTFVHAEVELVAGTTSEVELHFEKMVAISLRGRIVRSGSPMSSAFFFYCGKFSAPAVTLFAGSFETRLPQAGTWIGIVCPEGQSPFSPQSERRSFTFDVRAAGVTELALDFDALSRSIPADMPH